MELGKGYAFVARQQHIHTEKQDYYIDFVFYNYILKCFVLIDLKTEKITHQDDLPLVPGTINFPLSIPSIPVQAADNLSENEMIYGADIGFL